MNEKQMLAEFNLLWNNIMSNRAPGLNEYEISLFLTQAQDVIVNSICESFEQSESLISYLSPLVRQVTMEALGDGDESGENAAERMHVVPGSMLFRLPDGLVLRTFESLQAKSVDGMFVNMEVVPVTQDALGRTMSDPFKRPNERRALRLAFDYNVDESAGKYSGRYSEIICAPGIDAKDCKYTVRYITKPQPIILADLIAPLAIDGRHETTPCCLNENIQRKIIAKAVEIAKSVWS